MPYTHLQETLSLEHLHALLLELSPEATEVIEREHDSDGRLSAVVLIHHDAQVYMTYTITYSSGLIHEEQKKSQRNLFVEPGSKMLAVAPQGKMVASIPLSGETILLWNGVTGTFHAEVPSPGEHTLGFTTVAWSPDGTLLAAGTPNGVIYVWEVRTFLLVHMYWGHHDTITAIAWSPDGDRIASASGDRTLQVWSARTAERLLPLRTFNAVARDVSWSLDGKYIASGWSSGVVQVWQATTGKVLARYRGHSASVRSLSWSLESTQVASASDDGSVQVWWVGVGEQWWRRFNTRFARITRLSHSLLEGTFVQVTWSPDGTLLAAVHKGGVPGLMLWETTRFHQVAEYCDAYVQRCAWLGCGTRLLFASSSRVSLWNLSHESLEKDTRISPPGRKAFLGGKIC